MPSEESVNIKEDTSKNDAVFEEYKELVSFDM